MKSPIVLLSDFGYEDHYVACMKAVILSKSPRARIIDLTHGILPQNVMQAAMILKGSYSFFPKGTLFVCVVDPGVGTARRLLCVRSSRYVFVGPDNGVLEPVMTKEKGVQVRVIENRKFYVARKISSTFHGRDIMAPVAAVLHSRPSAFRQVGKRIALKARPVWNAARVSSNKLSGKVLYFDHFGNAITNIEKDLKDRRFWARSRVRVKNKTIGKMVDHYGPAAERPIALFNSFDHLEIAVPSGSARNRLRLKPGDGVDVTIGHA